MWEMKECFFRPLSVFLAAAMLIGIVQTGALPVYALEEGGTNSATQTENSIFKFMKATTDDTSGKCGENLTYEFDSSNGTITINGTGDMYYFGISPWDNLNVTTVKIEEGVTSIGVGAFSFCHSLTSITIPDSVTIIGSQAFRDCTNLTNIVIPSMVTSVDDEAFYGCENLTNITIPSNASSIGNEVFGGCTKLKRIDVDDSNKDFISSDGVLFDQDKTKLLAFPGGKKGSYTIPNSVNEVGAYAFSRCDNLTNVTIPDSVISIGEHAFFGTSLTNVLIPFSVTSIGTGAFASSFDLTSIDVAQDSKDYISKDGVLFNKSKTELLCFPVGKSYLFENGKYIIPSSVTKIGEEAFSQCLFNDDVTVPSNVTEIGNSAFEFATNLTSVTIPKSVTNIGNNAFWDCKELTDVYYSGSQANWDKISIGEYNDSLLDATIHYNSNGSDPQPATKHTVTVNSGTAAPEQAAKNVTVSIKADVAPNGQIFDQWESEDGVIFANANSASTTFKMPEKNVTVTATYKDLPDGTYTVTVVNGGVEVTNGIVTTTSAAVGTTVKIKADPAPSGKNFDKWTSADGVTFANATKAETTFEMPEKDVIVTANYKSTGGSSGGGSKGGGSKGGSSGSGKAPTQQPSSSTTTSTTVINGGTQVNISAPVGTANIPADLNAIMSARASGQNLNFTVNNSQTGQPAYTWSFNGAQLAQAAQIGNLNLAITVVPTASVPEVQSAVAGNSGIVLRFANNGQLPAPATITVNAKDQGYQPGQVLYFYYLNPTTGKLEIQNNGQPIIVNTQGYAAVIVTHNSDFVLLPAKISSAGSLALDTISYTMQKGKSYEIGAKLVGKGATLKVTSSRNGIAKVEQTKSGNYKVTALKDGITYVSFDVVVGGKVVSHSSVKITVQNGKAQGVSTQRVLNF